MERNTFRLSPESTEKNSFFTLIERAFKIDRYFENGIPVKYLPKVVFVSAFGILYIANSHYAEKTIRRIDKMQIQVENMRADYTTLKADYMFDSKQSEVAKNVADMGLRESIQPPFKIVSKER